jgi:hypothetical protein
MRPAKAPLRRVVEFLSGDPKAGDRPIKLKCGHTVYVRNGYYPASTKCYVCLREEVKAWEEAHTCPHGVVDDERECVECLKAQSACYRSALEEIANESEGWEKDTATTALGRYKCSGK